MCMQVVHFVYVVRMDQFFDWFLFFFLFFYQESKGFRFESETDTEVIPKLVKYFYDKTVNWPMKS